MGKKAVEKIEKWDVKKLIPYDKNSRIHPEKQIKQIEASIQRFGFLQPILVDTKSGIIADHGRLQAAKNLGMKDVPVIIVDHLTETEKRAYIIADNKIAENAEWDFEILSEEMQDLMAEFDDDLDAMGFTQGEIDKLMNHGEDASGFSNEENEGGHKETSDRVTVKVGEYGIKVDGHRFLQWEMDLKKSTGTSDEKVKSEILRRLKIQ